MFVQRPLDRQIVTVIQYQQRDRRAIRDLMEQPNHLHSQLDWYEVDAWIQQPSARVWTIWRGARLVGVLGVSETIDGAAWLRLAIIRAEVETDDLLHHAWTNIMPVLRAAGTEQVAVLVGEEWWLPHFGTLGFALYDEVVTLRRASMLLPSPGQASIHVRSVLTPDMPAILALDQAAFVAPWHMSGADLRQAERLCASGSVALVDGKVAGFQFSTFYFDGAHLARLAVHPDYQGRGVGHALMTDLILRMSRRSIYHFTVNTQLTNTTSQRLYHRFCFERTGYDLPVLTMAI
jgi:ribosomal-protein-alanine N-acetyltransferase